MPTSFHSRVSGVSFTNPDGSSRQEIIRLHCRSGLPLILTPEPDNPKDPHATSVHIQTPNGPVQIGYITARANEDVYPNLAAGRPVSAVITEVTGGTSDQPIYGINIEISTEATQRSAASPKNVRTLFLILLFIMALLCVCIALVIRQP